MESIYLVIIKRKAKFIRTMDLALFCNFKFSISCLNENAVV